MPLAGKKRGAKKKKELRESAERRDTEEHFRRFVSSWHQLTRLLPLMIPDSRCVLVVCTFECAEHSVAVVSGRLDLTVWMVLQRRQSTRKGHHQIHVKIGRKLFMSSAHFEWPNFLVGHFVFWMLNDSL